ncbi:hypothetical protein C8F04DRAFT_1259658 [Mycena alexandri]|uniref:Uncharacterized protein n=1 Tax=Mycena alexandri TaxID=1745969 RepID=A0AAD6X776_9AGAR|nr:hypothetical protein C8F04DRAFT_1259658 [Mycena alexandri]
MVLFAAQTADASLTSMDYLAEGRFNGNFLIAMRDDFQTVARIPYPATLPKYHAVASEAATTLLKSFELPTVINREAQQSRYFDNISAKFDSNP